MRKVFLLTLFFVFSVSLFSQNIDIRILRSLNSSQNLPSDGFFRLMSDSDPYIVFIVPAGLGTAGLLRHDEKLFREACVVSASVLMNSAVTIALKYSVNKDRPFVRYTDITKKSAAGSPSFPSGHTSSSFALATSLSLNYPEWYVIVPAYAWAGTVAYSRMDLGVHYPSDVLAGAIIGSGCAWLTHAVNKKLVFRKEARTLRN
jgi:membrane-associated phospholipid phosphatase